MSVTEKRIQNIEQTLTRQDEQIAKLFSDMSEIRGMFITVKGMWKGVLIGFGILLMSDYQIFEHLFKL